MYACIVRKPDGKQVFFLAAEDSQGEPQIPANWSIVTMTEWKPTTEEPHYSLSCAAQSKSGVKFSQR